MENSTLEQLRYPIGQFIAPVIYTKDYISDKIIEIESFPANLKEATLHLTDKQLDTPYREDGWTIRQVIHHCADSHMNCYIRIKWALTEDNPIIKFYYEERWSELNDNLTMPIAPTIAILEGLHYRLTYIMKGLTDIESEKTFIHPQHNTLVTIKEQIATYAWHGNHHLAHITKLKELKNWV